MSNEEKELDFDEEFIKYIFNIKNSYASFVKNDELQIQSPSYKYNETLKRFDKMTKTITPTNIQQIETSFYQMKEKCDKKKEHELMSYYIQSYNLVVLYQRSGRIQEALTLIDDIISNLNNTEQTIRISFLMAKASVLLDLYISHHEKKTWLQDYYIPLLSLLGEEISKESFPSSLSLCLQYRYNILQSIYYLEMASVKPIKKMVSKLQSFLPPFSSFLPLLIQQIKADYFRDQNNIHFFLLSQCSASIFTYLPLCIRASLEYHRENYQKVLNMLEATSMNPYSLQLKGNSEFALGHVNMAIFYYQRLVASLQPIAPSTKAIFYMNLGLFYQVAKQYEQRDICFSNALSLSPSHPLILYSLLYCYMLQPLPVTSLHSLYFLIQRVEQIQDSLEDTQKIQVAIWKLQILSQLHEYSYIQSLALHLLTLDTLTQYQQQQITLLLIEAYCNDGLLKECLLYLQPEENPSLYSSQILNEIHMEASNHSKQEENDLSQQLLYNLIQIYIELDDWGNAVKYAGLYHKIYHCRDSMQLYAHCLLLSGQGDKAMEIYNHYIQSD